MCRPASPTNLFLVGSDIYRRQISFNMRRWPQQGGCRSAKLCAWLFWRKPQPHGFQCLAVHLGLEPLLLMSPLMCAEGSHLPLSLPAAITCPSLPVCWCSDQSAINHQTNVRTCTGQSVLRLTACWLPASALWGWAFWGPGGRSYRQIDRF